MPTLAYNHIESSLNELPIQNRTMLRLLLLQYFPLAQEEIEFMAADQPDSRFMSGEQPKENLFSKEAIVNVSNRASQYQTYLRQKRERPGLQVECLEQLMAYTAKELKVLEQLMTEEFAIDRHTQDDYKTQAMTALVKQNLRKLSRAFEEGEVSDEDYQKKRLLLEYQLLLRRQQRQRRQLMAAKQDFQLSGKSPLKDHEIAHIWGIPLGSLAARKVKALHLYLTSIQKCLHNTNGHSEASGSPEASEVRPDFWQQTLQTLSTRPLERSVVAYGGQERTEEQLMEKLEAFVMRKFPEEEETKFWASISKIHDSEHAGMWTSHERAIYSLQRLSAILNEVDQSDEAIAEDLQNRTAPPTSAEQLPEPEETEDTGELNEETIGILQKLVGELDDKRRT
ncbi:MAG: hypothetical protein NPIRA02_21440 [Nitrospirales bacterium]|nr:MAG: hypothetical protein NPIRA02_21440 [Nitrospirales bacterium]